MGDQPGGNSSAMVEFLLARLAEDEQTATGAEGRVWLVTGEGSLCDATTGAYLATGPWDSGLGDTGEHIARHDPASVLRDVEAKRGIVRLYAAARQTVAGPTSRFGAERQQDIGAADALMVAAWALARLYDDPPDYDASWRPLEGGKLRWP